MTMNALFTNDSEIEKVTTYAGFGKEKGPRRNKLIFAATAVMIAIVITMIFMIPSDYRVMAGLISAVLFGTAIVWMWIKAPGGREKDSAMTGVGLIRTGDSEKYHYEFFETGFSVTKDEKKEYEYSSLSSVRDIGGAYQIKTADASYTVKKAGFSEDGDNRFRALMGSRGITIK